MAGDRRAAIVIPCFNEERRLIPGRLAQFINEQSACDLVIVDDGSQDNTLALIRQLATAAPHRIRVTTLGSNQGKAEAVRQGLLWSALQGYRVVGFWDADLATPLTAVAGFLDVLQRQPDVEVIWGTRLPLLGHRIDRGFLRRQAGRVFSFASAVAVGIPMRDALCGAKLFRNTPRLKTILSTPFSSRWIFDVELIARFQQQFCQLGPDTIGQRIFEYPLVEWQEVGGSKLRLHDFVRAAGELSGLFLQYRAFPRRPVSGSADLPATTVSSLRIREIGVGDEFQQADSDQARRAAGFGFSAPAAHVAGAPFRAPESPKVGDAGRNSDHGSGQFQQRCCVTAK